MANHTIPQKPFIGQTQPGSPPAHPIAIQQNINTLRRQLVELDTAFIDLLTRQRELQAALLAERERYADALGADRLAEQGAGAVAEALALLETT